MGGQVRDLISWPTTYLPWARMLLARSSPILAATSWFSRFSLAASRFQRGVAGSVIRLRRCLRARHGVGSPGVRLGYLRAQGAVAQQRDRRGTGERADDYDRGSHTEDDA